MRAITGVEPTGEVPQKRAPAYIPFSIFFPHSGVFGSIRISITRFPSGAAKYFSNAYRYAREATESFSFEINDQICWPFSFLHCAGPSRSPTWEPEKKHLVPSFATDELVTSSCGVGDARQVNFFPDLVQINLFPLAVVL